MSDLLERLGWLSAESLVSCHTLCLVDKVCSHGEPEELAAGFTTVAEARGATEESGRITRQDRDVFVPRSRTEMGKRRFSCCDPVLYNALPPDLQEFPYRYSPVA